jgi:flagellin-like protein
MDKKGISAIVATVLVILITVAGVAIIWVGVLPMISESFEFSEDCECSG